MTAPVPLNPVDHPAGTRVLCKLKDYSATAHEYTVVEWARSGVRVRLGPYDPLWIIDDLPLVVEVLERPKNEHRESVGSHGDPVQGASGPAIAPDEAQDAETASAVARSGPSRGTTGHQGSPPSTPPPRDPALIERARAFLSESNWAPYASSVPTAHFYADFASAEVAREGEKFREARSKFWSELQLARSRAEAAEAEVAARDARIAALEQERDEALQLEDLAVASFEQGCQLAARDKEIERWESNQRKLLAEISELKKQSAPSPSGHWTRDPVPEEWHGREFELRNDDRQWRCRLNAGWALALDAHRWSTPIPLPGEERSEACEVERLRVEAIEEVSAYAITQAKMEEVDGFDGAGESWREIARLCRALLRAEDADDARSHWTYTDGSALGSPPIVSPPEAMLAESARRETEKGDWQWLLRRAALADELAARIREIHKAICDPARARHHEMCMMYELDPEDREEPPK